MSTIDIIQNSAIVALLVGLALIAAFPGKRVEVEVTSGDTINKVHTLLRLAKAGEAKRLGLVKPEKWPKQCDAVYIDDNLNHFEVTAYGGSDPCWFMSAPNGKHFSRRGLGEVWVRPTTTTGAQ